MGAVNEFILFLIVIISLIVVCVTFVLILQIHRSSSRLDRNVDDILKDYTKKDVNKDNSNA